MPQIDQIVNEVSERTGLSKEMSRKVVEIVVTQIANYLPEPYSTQVKGMLAVNKAKDQVASKLKGLGSMFGM
ncbi:MAG: hypothetical protein ACPGWR_28465 [Ardenticatenaceae bacterium]